jgi:hypothetical protein
MACHCRASLKFGDHHFTGGISSREQRKNQVSLSNGKISSCVAMAHQGSRQYFSSRSAFQMGVCQPSFEIHLAHRIRASLMLEIRV